MSSYHNPNLKSSSLKKINITKEENHIIRPMYDRDDKIIGYISVPITEWARTLKI